MSEGKRYYWLRLHDDFFNSKRIKKLRKMAGGDTFTIIYLKMQLIAMKNDGVIKYTGLEDNFAEELALDLDEEPANVSATLFYLLSCGLAETSDEINFFFPYAVENTGSEGSSAKRNREYRERLKASQCDAGVTLALRGRDGEIEKEIEIDKRDIDRDREIERRHKYGRYNNVLLSDADMEKLKAEYPEDYDQRIERLSEYIASTGKKYKSHLATIRAWARKDGENKKEALPF